MSFFEAFELIVISFFFVAYLMVLFSVITDLFRDAELGGGAKAVWVVLLIVLPLITSLVYLVVRGGGMAERQASAAHSSKERADEYIRPVAAVSPADQIKDAKALLDSGAITATEFASLKAKALA